MSGDMMPSDMEGKAFTRGSPMLRTFSTRRSLVHSPSSLDVSQLPTYALQSSMRRKNYLHRRSRSYDTSIPDLTSLKLFKSERKKSYESLLEYDHTAAVFDAVKQDDLNELEAILDVRSEAINDVNGDCMSVLDVALLLNSHSISGYLLRQGAKTHLLGAGIENCSMVMATLDQLIGECEQAIATLSGTLIAISTKYKDHGRKLKVWMNKRKLLKKMKANYNVASLPCPPENVELAVTSRDSLRVSFQAPQVEASLEGVSPVIGYHVEWCSYPTFLPELTQETHLQATSTQLHHELTGLLTDVPYYVRISSYNMKGFSESSPSEPTCATPHSWRDCPSVEALPKIYNAERLQELYNEAKAYRSLDDSSSSSSGPDFSPPHSKPSNHIKRSFRGFFSGQSAKFAKSVKRGVYLACVFHHNEKILVTDEDKYLPMVEVDDSYNSTSLSADYSWMLKVSCHWEDVKQLKYEMERLTSVTSYSLRHQLLTAASQLQNLLGINDLGLLHHQPIKDPHTGAVVFVLVKNVVEPKHLGGHQHLKWTTVLKLLKNNPHSDCLMQGLSEMMSYRQVCDAPLPAGLYLGYLQSEIFSGTIHVHTSEIRPNSLPSVKIRDNSCVSKTEWQSLLNLSPLGQPLSSRQPLDKQMLQFQKDVTRAARKLVESLDISTQYVVEHRLYDYEVLEFSPSVSMIILLPPRSHVCSMPASESSTELVSKSRHLGIPLKTFEMSHLRTYQTDFINAYTRATVLIDMEYTSAQQAHREAFSNSELEVTKQHVEDMKSYQQSLEETWGRARWATNVISMARERQYVGIPLKHLYHSVLIQHERTLDTQKSQIDEKLIDNGYHSNRQSLVESLPSPSSSIEGVGDGKTIPDQRSTLIDVLVYDKGSKIHSTGPLVNV